MTKKESCGEPVKCNLFPSKPEPATVEDFRKLNKEEQMEAIRDRIVRVKSLLELKERIDNPVVGDSVVIRGVVTDVSEESLFYKVLTDSSKTELLVLKDDILFCSEKKGGKNG